MDCRATNTCPICGTQEPCCSVHLSAAMRRTSRHRDGLCLECLRWMCRRRDELGRTANLGPSAGERQARAELRRAARELEPKDFRSFREPSR
jgi:hypothetical protein